MLDTGRVNQDMLASLVSQRAMEEMEDGELVAAVHEDGSGGRRRRW